MKKLNPNFILKFAVSASLVLLFGCEMEKENPKYGSVTDIDGNVYKTVTIGSQNWMAENLRVTKYNDGTPIQYITDDTEWLDNALGAYCAYNNTTDTDTIYKYGYLYNSYAVNTGKLAPEGWHIPTDEEWEELTTYLGGIEVAGRKLKEGGTSHWNSPNTGATNESGFTALPGGYRWDRFDDMGEIGLFYSATLTYGITSFYLMYHRGQTKEECMLTSYRCYTVDFLMPSYGTERCLGISVRCIKDQ
jgi:uncharacterized protein (TIGR02145 family)